MEKDSGPARENSTESSRQPGNPISKATELMKYLHMEEYAGSAALAQMIFQVALMLSSSLTSMSRALKVAKACPPKFQETFRSLYATAKRALDLVEENKQLPAPQRERNILSVELLLIVEKALEFLEDPFTMLTDQTLAEEAAELISCKLTQVELAQFRCMKNLREEEENK
ncbi:hypothetical protein M514_26738 [Trichuris suis]|uniref:Uncharacterized protein n=1 Tax=Trichuris suis TaxID=68888 RepID=A0A085LK07_9BILA|nr:hypothetical protein M513_13820 [Trichuris suis]KFD48037.1 hypothetical protein M513_11057 [Trichuris suis]KFD58460.1 hypothetical protein M513_00686 [Trichuris suis]KFD61096.1 hypothetical protein M514_26738 [Trichuris suis]